MNLRLSLLFLLALLPLAPHTQAAQVLRNLVHIEGVRENPLIGYGLVVGLNGSGDSTQVKFAGQSVSNMLKQFGVKLPDGVDAKSKNVATVMVSAVFPPGYRKGQGIDVTVSSVGDAKNLRGGTLLLTQLRAADGEVYALAQGNLVVGGLNAQGKSGSSVTVNTPTSGRIPNGARIEREIETDFDTHPTVRLSLRHPHFQTATNIVDVINRRFGNIASTRDATSIDVVAPENPTQRVAFVAAPGSVADRRRRRGAEGRLQLAHRHRGDRRGRARCVRQRSSHGSLKVVISESTAVSQPQPFGRGQTVVTPQSEVAVEQGNGRMFKWPAGASLQTHHRRHQQHRRHARRHHGDPAGAGPGRRDRRRTGRHLRTIHANQSEPGAERRQRHSRPGQRRPTPATGRRPSMPPSSSKAFSSPACCTRCAAARAKWPAKTASSKTRSTATCSTWPIPWWRTRWPASARSASPMRSCASCCLPPRPAQPRVCRQPRRPP